ncbi:MAG: formate-dependent phosphoribosylglycinamide formyltransferase [Actinobacteria bacterium]|nr:formate-dependent phosphoribosylglycinamide formyltransferase [Actinomycetota bacterium]
MASVSGASETFSSIGDIPETYVLQAASVATRAGARIGAVNDSESSPPTIGTPGTPGATRIVLLGSGELGREVAIEAVRLGCEVVACDRYAGAPAMAVAHRHHVLTMHDPGQLRAVLDEERHRPHSRLIVVPEIEAIATDVLEDLAAEGLEVIPTARAARLTMDREGIRRLAAEQLGLPTSPYRFCDDEAQLRQSIGELGLPCVVKPLMSSSGKGQSIVRSEDEIAAAWSYSQEGARAGGGRVICEAFVDFDYELTLLTVRHLEGTSFCAPIGHTQEDGDYRESWQPAAVAPDVLDECRRVAAAITDALGGRGIFGVELFVAGDQVIFSEVSPRPHDTGMVTLASQRLSEFALHVRAILGLHVPAGEIPLEAPAAASAVILGEEAIDAPAYDSVTAALAQSDEVDVRLFGKPGATPGRRMGVALARGATEDQARDRARAAAQRVRVGGA